MDVIDPYLIQLTQLLHNLEQQYAKETRERNRERTKIRRLQTGLELTPPERARTGYSRARVRR